MNDLIMEFLSELQSAQEAHNKALEDAFDAHQKADTDAFNDHSERIKLAREKLAAAMNARFLAWNGEIGVDTTHSRTHDGRRSAPRRFRA